MKKILQIITPRGKIEGSSQSDPYMIDCSAVIERRLMDICELHQYLETNLQNNGKRSGPPSPEGAASRGKASPGSSSKVPLTSPRQGFGQETSKTPRPASTPRQIATPRQTATPRPVKTPRTTSRSARHTNEKLPRVQWMFKVKGFKIRATASGNRSDAEWHRLQSMVRRFLQRECLLSQIQTVRSPSGGIQLQLQSGISHELEAIQAEEEEEEAMPSSWLTPRMGQARHFSPSLRVDLQLQQIQDRDLEDRDGDIEDSSTEESPLIRTSAASNGRLQSLKLAKLWEGRLEGPGREPHAEDSSTEESPLISCTRGSLGLGDD